MKVKELKLALITSGVLIISAFIPLIQIILGMLNGSLIYIIEILTTVERSNLILPINLILLLSSLILYWKWTTLWKRILALIILIFSINGIFLITFDRLFINEEYYWFPFIIESTIMSLLILIIDLTKNIAKFNSIEN
ncbi:hypothetical protein SAMN04487764_2733 [Gillisia sp. Hel1_33_143]|uniref:hypothetical protein n=1 Tax=Gillisia sp. Hel1_33_143 TaxID=1336796 RepID=UPI00087B8E5E|nr:hypothetical protein [Gillisia sp. Hel1_33_143]SDS65724.1 hypothetical protein SAMN04487764_2733 [Gillisia sp. Hel1_33_143]